MPLRGVYIPHFDQILVKCSVLEVLYPYRCTDGVKFGTKEGASLTTHRAEFHSHRRNVLPLWGEKAQNRPLSNLTTGAFRCAPCCRNKAQYLSNWWFENIRTKFDTTSKRHSE